MKATSKESKACSCSTTRDRTTARMSICHKNESRVMGQVRKNESDGSSQSKPLTIGIGDS